MRVRVSSEEFVKAVNSISSGKQVINITLTNRILMIQITDPIIVNIPVPIINCAEEYVGDTYSSISVDLGGSQDLLPDNVEVDLIFSKEVLTIKTNGFECRYASMYEDMFNIPTTFSESFKDLDTSGNLDTVVKNGQYVSSYAKAISTQDPAISVKSRNAYIIAGSVVVKSELNFPDSVWGRKVLRTINSIFHTYRITSPTLRINKDSGVYGVVEFGQYKEMTFSMSFGHNTQINAINDLIEKSVKVCNVGIGSLSDKIKIIEKIYKKAGILITLGDGTYSLTVKVGSNQELVIGTMKPGAKLYTTIISIPLLTLINNLFRTSGGVSVYVTGRYLILKDNFTTFMTSGLIEYGEE